MRDEIRGVSVCTVLENKSPSQRWILTLLVDSEKLQNFASTSRLVSFSLYSNQKEMKKKRVIQSVTSSRFAKNAVACVQINIQNQEHMQRSLY